MSEDAQHLKKAAALAYDYESDPRWIEYWSNVLVPDNRPKSEVERYFKFKFYQRNIDTDLKVEPLSSKSASTSSSTRSSSFQRPLRPEERSSSAQATSHSGARGNGGVNSIRVDQHSIGFLSNALAIIMGAFAILPFMPQALSAKSYRLTFLGTLVANGHSIYVQYGRPRALNLQAIQIWLQSVVAGKDFLYFLYSIVFISTLMPIKFAMIPVICQSLLNVAQFLKRNFSNTNIYRKYLENSCKWLEANNATMRSLSANCEIGLGFLLVFLLLAPQKNFVQLVVYWQLLKLMYHSPTTASFHRTIWSRIGIQVNPLIHRYATFLESPLQFAKRWFHN